MNTIAIVQARLASERLPGKVLEKIGDHTAVDHVWKRTWGACHGSVIAVPAKDARTIKETLGMTHGVIGWDGPEEDVLGRFAHTAELYSSYRVIVRLTADCPFVDVEGIKAVAQLVESGTADYATTNPGGMGLHAICHLLVDGYDAEAFTRELLMQAHDNAITKYDREHVTPWMWREARSPWIVQRNIPSPDGFGAKHHHWTLDTPEDLAWFRAVAEEIDVTPPLHPTYEELMALLERRPDLVRTGQ